jgi:hypothetical protein
LPLADLRGEVAAKSGRFAQLCRKIFYGRSRTAATDRWQLYTCSPALLGQKLQFCKIDVRKIQ